MSAITAEELNALNEAFPYVCDPFRGGYVYACQFSDGLIKVGLTRSPANRLRTLQQVAKRERGAEMTGAYGIRVDDRHQTERVILDEVASIRGVERRGEWFANVEYLDVMQAVADAADLAASRAPTPETAQGA